MMATVLEYALLGPLEVRRVDATGESTRLTLGPPKQRAVLAVLLLEAGRVVSTDRLVDAVWGGEAPGSVLTSLQAYVSHLRRLLRDDERATTPLARQAPGYRCDVEADQLDVTRFAGLASAAEAAAVRRDWAEAGRLAADAVGLWRGPVLADLADEEWVRVAAAGWEERRTAARHTLVTALLGQDRVSAAVAEAGRLVAEHPLDERACWLHLVAQHRSGRTAVALEGYRAYADRLDEELGLEPGPALRDLQGALLRQDPDLDAWPRAVHESSVPGVVEPPAAAPAAASERPDDLVGRDRELAAAGEVLDRRTGWIVLAGAAGIGKSRLADACAARWEAAGGVVARVACPDFAGLPAWWPVRQVLLDLGEDPEAVLVPPTGVDIDAARFATYEMVRARLRAAIVRPVLVLIDDVHWADDTSLAFLTLLAESGGVPGLVVLLTARSGVGGPELDRLLAAVARTGACRHVTVPPLTTEEVVELATRVSGGAVDPTEAAALARRTGGNPFFVSEYARLPDDVRKSGGVPGAVRSVLERRLSGVDPDVLAVLRPAAVIGRTLDLDLLGRVTRLDRDDLADLLDDAADEHLIVPASGTGGYEFVHALMREQVAAGLTGLRRQRLHLRVAGELAARGGYDAMVGRAAHLVAGLPLSEPAEVVTACRAAAREAEARWQSEDAARWWGQAIAAIDLLPVGEQGDRDELVVAQVAAYARAGRGRTVLETVDDALASAMRSGRLAATGRLARTLLRSTGAWPWAVYGNEGDGVLRGRLATLAEGLPHGAAARVQVLATLAVGSCYGPDPGVPDRLSAEALALAERLGDDDLLADALLARALTFSGVAERAVESVGLLERLAGLPHAQARIDEVLCHNLGSMALLMLGRVDEAADHVRRGIVGSELLRLPVSRVQLRWIDGELTQWYGDLGLAAERLDQAFAIHQQTELYQAGVREISLLTVGWDAGRLADLDVTGVVNPALAWMAVVVDAARRTPGSTKALRAEVAREEPVIWTTHGRWTLLAHVVCDLGLTDLGPLLRARLLPLAGHLANVGQVGTLGPIDLALARLAVLAGDTAAARAHVAAATELCVAGRARRHLVRCRLLAAQLAGALPADTADLAAEADRLGMPWVAPVLDGLRVRDRPAG